MTYGSRFLLAALGVGLALLCLVAVLWYLKNRAPSSVMVKSGRSRQPRLRVLDTAAVDARRRLVLVRRDEVEHLLMIGGPTDIVVESRIGEPVYAAEPRQSAQLAATAARIASAYEDEDEEEAPAPRPRALPAAPQRARTAAAQRPQQPPPRAPQPEPEPEEDEDYGANYYYDEDFDDVTEEEEQTLAELLEASRGRASQAGADHATPPEALRRDAGPRVMAERVQNAETRAQNGTAAGGVSGGDFQRVLEQEIALHLAQQPQPAARPAAPARQPAQPQPVAAFNPAPHPQVPLQQGPQAAYDIRAAAAARQGGNGQQSPNASASSLAARAGIDPRQQQEERRLAAALAANAAAARPQPAALARPAAAPQPPPSMRQPALQTAGRGMANGIESQRMAQPRQPAPQPRPAQQKQAGQANLQNEIARIFGEISTKRGK